MNRLKLYQIQTKVFCENLLKTQYFDALKENAVLAYVRLLCIEVGKTIAKEACRSSLNVLRFTLVQYELNVVNKFSLKLFRVINISKQLN